MMQKKLKPVIFLDRDGVINEDLDYVYRIEDFKFIAGVFEACQKFLAAGFGLVIITNQAGIARGYYTERDFEKLNQWMLKQFKDHGIDITDVYYCPHHPEHGVNNYKIECDCRKPEPGMLLQAAQQHAIDLSQSILIGDKLSDINVGRRAGLAHNYLVRTGKTVTSEISQQADQTFNDLLAAANSISESSVLN